MSVETSIDVRTFEGISWLAFYKFFSQLLSWTVTIFVARMLIPDDYGLMAMATIITGYAEMFSELGLGAAIIQRPKLTRDELSSIFWFTLIIAILFGLTCFAVAYPTAHIFSEPRVIPLTQAVSILFLITGLQIVPLNLLKKELNFKQVGMIETSGVFVSCSFMLVVAYLGWGVWTLIGGRIVLNFTKLVMLYIISPWRPKFHFNLSEVKQHIKFGIVVAIGGSFRYLYGKSDRLFAGRAWSPLMLGYYTFALQLSQIPTEKIVTLINQVSFSAFSSLQHDKDKFNNMYLKIIKMTATIVLPLYVGGFLVGEQLVKLLLSDKWMPIILVFKLLCLVQVITALNAVNNFVHTAQGRPKYRLYFYAILSILMPVSFYFAIQKGFNYILLPWFITYLITCLVWIFITLNKIGIPKVHYLKNMQIPFIATILMAIVVFMTEYLVTFSSFLNNSDLLLLIIKMSVASITYIGFFLIYDRKFLFNIRKMMKS